MQTKWIWTAAMTHRRLMRAHPRVIHTRITGCTLTESRFQANEGPRTIIGAETSIASTVTSSICLTLLFTLTLSKSILEAQMAKSSPCPQVAAGEEGQRSPTVAPLRSAKTLDLKTFSLLMSEKVVQSTLSPILQRCMNRSFTSRNQKSAASNRKFLNLRTSTSILQWRDTNCTNTWNSSRQHSTREPMLGRTFTRITITKRIFGNLKLLPLLEIDRITKAERKMLQKHSLKIVYSRLIPKSLQGKLKLKIPLKM